MTTTHGTLTISTEDHGDYYVITAPHIPIGHHGDHIRIYASWNPGDTRIDTRIDMEVAELAAGDFGDLVQATEDARKIVEYIETNWWALIDAHLATEPVAA